MGGLWNLLKNSGSSNTNGGKRKYWIGGTDRQTGKKRTFVIEAHGLTEARNIAVRDFGHSYIID